MTEFLQSETVQTLIIIAPIGSGKTTFCNHSFEMCKNKYRIHSPNLETIETHKQFIEQIENFLTIPARYNVKNEGLKNLPCLLFFDNIEIICSHDRYANSYINSLIEKQQVKIVITCSTGEERRTTDFKKKKNVIIIRLEEPTIEEIVNVYGEHMRARAIAAHRNVGTMLKGNDMNTKYFDKNIYQIIEKTFEENDGISGIQMALCHDQSLVSFMMYDNYHNVFTKKHKMPQPQKFNDAFQKIAKVFIDTSILEELVFKSNDFNAVESLNIVRCQTIRMEQEKLPKQSQGQKTPEIQYTQINSRSAQHYNISKKICDLNMFFDDIAINAEEHFKRKCKPSSKTDLGTIMNSYILNYCKL